MLSIFIISKCVCVCIFLCKCFVATYVTDVAKSRTGLLQPGNLHKCTGDHFSQEIDLRIDL